MLLLMLNCFGRIFLTERRIVQKNYVITKSYLVAMIFLVEWIHLSSTVLRDKSWCLGV